MGQRLFRSQVFCAQDVFFCSQHDLCGSEALLRPRKRAGRVRAGNKRTTGREGSQQLELLSVQAL